MRQFLAGATTGFVVVLVVVAFIGPRPAAPKAAPAPPPAAPAQTSLPTPDALRSMIHAGDRAAVAQALSQVSADTRDAQQHQRALFGVFSEVHPDVIAFARDWATADPTNPAALTARGWSLFSQGWSFRGEGYAHSVNPQAMQAFVAAHSEGLALMQQAAQLDPGLLAASDGVLRMSYTVGRADLIAPEVARIMAIHPNRFTMTLAGQGTAPNWGGSLTAMELLCRAYAPKVTDRPGYDAKVCLADGIMQSGVMSFAEMHSAIGGSDNPLVMEWQDQDADIQGETAAEKLAHLDKLKATRPLSYLEANIYDQMSEVVASMTGEARPKEFPAAVARKAENARSYADRNPGDWKGAKRLLYALMENRDINGTAFDSAEFNARAAASLQINPFNADAWSHIGMAKLLGAAKDEEAGIRAAEPYFINAVVYSNHASEHLKSLGGLKLGLLFRNMSNGVKPANPKLWQDGVLCPMVRQLRLLEAACAAEGKEFAECSGLPWDDKAIQAEIVELTSAGLCEAEANAPLESLGYSPMQVDLSLE